MKLMLDEPETQATRELWRGASIVSSTWLTVVETRSAIARARRMGRLTVGRMTTAIAEADRLFREVDLIEVAPRLITSAAELAEAHGLRGYDAVHLASALALGDPEVVVATWDADLAAAAQAEGFAVPS